MPAADALSYRSTVVRAKPYFDGAKIEKVLELKWPFPLRFCSCLCGATERRAPHPQRRFGQLRRPFGCCFAMYV